MANFAEKRDALKCNFKSASKVLQLRLCHAAATEEV